LGDKIEKNEVGGACSSYGGRGEACTGFWSEDLRERDHLECPGIDGRKWDVGWTGLSWLRTDRWWALGNAVINLWVA